MSRGAGRENCPQVAIGGKIGNSPGNAVDVSRHERSRLVGEHGIRHAADRGGNAGQAAGRGFEIDQPEAFDPAGCIRLPGKGSEQALKPNVPVSLQSGTRVLVGTQGF